MLKQFQSYLLGGLALLICSGGLPLAIWSQENPAPDNSPEPAADQRSLHEIQGSISARYQRFSKTLTQLHGYMKQTDPARAELLMRVIGKSNEARVEAQLDSILELMRQDNPQYGGIVERQEELIGSLMTLLDVLQSEDERKRLTDEIARLEELIGNLNELVVDQKEVRAGTERGRPTEGLKDRQQSLTEKTKDLADKIEQQDREKQAQQNQNSPESDADGEPKAGSESPSDPKSPEKQSPSEDEKSPTKDPSESKESKPNEGESGKPSEQGQKSDSEQDPSEQSPSESGEQSPQPGQKSGEMPPTPGGEQQKSDSQPSQQTPPAEQTQGKEEIESAIEKMQKAIEELKDKNRDKASREQDRAIAELEKAKAKLEEILRQLREEEQKIVLAALEARFRQMLQQQVSVRKSTAQITEVAPDKRLPRHRARSTQLARDERDIVQEADKALILLQEEGTSVAFPEAVLQLREDMQTVAERLNEFQVDDLTLAIEDDIIESLSEMIEALRQEMEKLEEKQQQQQQQQQGEPTDPALVDLIAELKLLRSLQYRVNRRTQQFGRQIDGEQASEQELLKLLRQLSERQARIQRATYDLSVGRNQ